MNNGISTGTSSNVLNLDAAPFQPISSAVELGSSRMSLWRILSLVILNDCPIDVTLMRKMDLAMNIQMSVLVFGLC